MKIPVGRQALVLSFCVLHHGTQKRKYTNEPYINHCRGVAETVDEIEELGWEIAMCHDLLEDTDCTSEMLFSALREYGYTILESNIIVNSVEELSDEYTHEKYPHLNRKTRKKLEAQRLYSISSRSQTVKYADLINNTESIVEHDPGFAVKYLQEKEEILKGMDDGNYVLYYKALDCLEKAKIKLKEIKNGKS